MPPEPLPPWDRKEFFRERKHDRSETIGGSVARWRDSAHHGSRDLNRWGSSDIRRTPGHGKQGGWHFFSEESQHSYASSRSGEKVGDDENFRPFSRVEGRYGRNNNRDNRGTYNQREWRGHAWETNSGFSNTPVRAHDVGNEHKAREDVQSYSSHSNGGGGFGNTWDHLRPKDQQDKTSGSNAFAPAHKCNGEDGTGLNDWKPIKWTRSGSLSSRGSGFSHLTSSKSGGAIDRSEPKVETETKNSTPIRSPSGDANACVTSSAAASDETSSRKKPRLGWGEGLAKYEKKKVDGPDGPFCSKDGAGTSASGDVEHFHPSSVEKSPRLMSLSDCGSPATPSSVACSSSPGLEEKSFGKAVNFDNDVHNICGSPGPASRDHCEEELSFNLENLDSNSADNFAVVLYDLLRTNDSNSMDSSYMMATALNKVLILKGNISKNLEMTESEIDLLETELKSLNTIVGGSPPSASCSLPLLQDNVKSCNEHGDAKELLSRPPPLQIISSGDATMDKSPACNGGQEEIVATHKDVDVDSPGTVTSKFVEPLSIAKPVLSDVTHHAAADAIDVCLTDKEVKESKHSSGVRKSNVSAPGVGEKTVAINSSFVLGSANKMSHHMIFSSNKELAKDSHEVFNKLLPRRECKLKIAATGNASSFQHYASAKENFAARKRFLKFKERVITLKFKAFQHLWKEDMRLLSIRKQRAKSHKKFELSMRSLHNGFQKHRSSIRSRFSSPAGSISLVPTTEVINFTKKLLEESQTKLYRDTLKMPALILDKREKIASRFISNNGLVEDPCAVEKARAIMNPWTPAEKEIFMEKFAILGKDFKKIASFLDHKTTADCVDFYYKNHKSDCFEKKKLDVSKQDKSCTNSNYLMTLGKRWNRERNSASLDILGAASVIAANADSRMRNRHGSSRRLILGGCGQSKAAWGDDVIAERSSSFDFARNERETAAADVLAGICGSLSSEAMSSCITSSADPGESYRDWKCQRSSTFRRPFTPDVMQNGDDETCSDESCGEMDSTDWTDEEKSVFIQAVSSYGKDYLKISHCVRTRSRDQCKVFFSKARKCLGLDLMHPEPGSERMSVGDGGNGSGSGSDNVCALEVGSGACSDKSGSKMDEDMPMKPMKMSHAVSNPAETVTSQTALIGANLKNEEPVDHNSENVGGPELHESDGSQSWGRPNAVSEGDSNIVVGVDDQSEMILVNESESVLVSLDSGRKEMSEVGAESQSTCAEPVKHVPTVDANPVTDEKEVDEKRSASPVTQSSSLCDAKSVGIASQFAADGSCSAFRLNGNYKHHPVSLASVSAQRGHSVDFQASSGGCRVSTIFRDESREHLTGLPLLTNAESSQVALRGFPSQMPVQKEMNGVVNCRNLGAAPSLLTSDRGSADPFTSHAYYLQKCSTTSKSPYSVAEFPLVSQKIEQAMLERSEAHSRSLSDSENSSRRSGGDVKLFGKILSNPSLGQKANGNHCEKEVEDKGSLTYQHHHNHNHNHKLGNKSSTNLRFANLHNPDGAVLKFDPSSYLGLENVKMRSYAYWDGTRLQATFPSIPDSAILLAKYPNAFTNFTTPGIDHTADRGNMFPAREIGGSDGLVDFRRGNGGKVQPYTVDMREALAGFQHPGRGVVGVNMVGRGGIVVGGTGGVSDPVAALKLHFAKTAESRGEEGTRGT